MAHLDLQNVTKVYPGGVRAVNDLNLQASGGECVVLVGPSGCGKSTTLRMIAGLEEVTSGRILLGGRLINDLPPRDRDVAMVFQSYALYPHMTVYRNLAFSLKLRGVKRVEREERVRSAARLLGIEDLLGRRPRELSGGQRQRVALGRAIVRRPAAFLLDEPLSNLDSNLRGTMRAELKKLHRQLGTTSLYVTHDQEEAMTLGDRVAVMKDGAIQQCAPPLELYRRPDNRFVAGFIGTPPMNFIHGRVFAEGKDLYFLAGSGKIRLPERFYACLRGRPASEMVLGIRPESLSCFPSHEQGNSRLEGRVTLVEPLGDKMDVHVQTPVHEHIICRVQADDSVSDGMRVPIYMNMDQVQLFEPGDEGVNVNRSGAGDRSSAMHTV